MVTSVDPAELQEMPPLSSPSIRDMGSPGRWRGGSNLPTAP